MIAPSWQHEHGGHKRSAKLGDGRTFGEARSPCPSSDNIVDMANRCGECTYAFSEIQVHDLKNVAGVRTMIY